MLSQHSSSETEETLRDKTGITWGAEVTYGKEWSPEEKPELVKKLRDFAEDNSSAKQLESPRHQSQ